MEYRYYEVPEKCPVLVLQGEKWLQNYGYQIDYLHFHNLMEIGFCYYGEGTIVLEDEELPYHGGMFTVVPKNFPHTTNSKENSVCSWAWVFVDVEGFITELYKGNMRMAQKLIARINQKAHFVKNEERPEVAEMIKLITINEQISNFAQTYPTNLKASSNEALLFMRRYRFANCSCFSCCFKDAYPSSNVQ